jgi:hypothetical protein
LTVRKKSAHVKNSPFTLAKRVFGDSSETLGISGVPHGLPLAKSWSPKTNPIKREWKSTLKNTSPGTPPKTTKSKPFQRENWGKVTTQRGTRSSYVKPNKNPSKKCIQNFTTNFSRKGSENHQKEKLGETTKGLEESR